MNMNKARLQRENKCCESDSPAEDEAHGRRIKTLPELTDGRELLQLSNQKVYEARKAFLYKVLFEIEELGLLKSHRPKQVSSIINDTRALEFKRCQGTVWRTTCKYGSERGENRYLVPLPLPVPCTCYSFIREKVSCSKKSKWLTFEGNEK
jgi:hypothetical protein